MAGPDHIQTELQNALSAHHAGRLTEAIAAYEAVLDQSPDQADVLGLHGLALLQSGRMADAVRSLRRAVEIHPDMVEAWNNLGYGLERLDRPRKALHCYERALQLQPGYYDALDNLGNVLKTLDRLEESLDAYRRAIEQDATRPDAWINLAGCLEEAGRTEESLQAVRDAQRQNPDHPQLRLAAARALRRLDQPDAAVAELESIRVDTLPADTRRNVLYEMARVYDQLGRFPAAFRAAQDGNAEARALWTRAQPGPGGFLAQVTAFRELFSPAWVRRWTPVDTDDAPDPVFLVGFPRSGTTLVDTMLDAHPEVSVLEERPTVPRLMESLFAKLGGRPDRLPDLDAAAIRELRRAYFEHAAALTGPDPGVLVDKLPLNLVSAGFLHRLFPHARYVLVVRNPLDVCLSCFMQPFVLNDAMSGFLELETTAATYDAVMSLWRHYTTVLPLKVHELRYEDLIAAPEPVLRSLLDFLGLDWHEATLAHDTHALRRGRIRTPSHSQVSQPVYTHARERWRNYEKQMRPVMDTLKPWLEHWNY